MKLLRILGFACVAAGALAACGGDNNNNSTPSNSSPQADAFVAQVQGVIATPNADQQQPVSTSGITPTANNTSQPVSY